MHWSSVVGSGLRPGAVPAQPVNPTFLASDSLRGATEGLGRGVCEICALSVHTGHR